MTPSRHPGQRATRRRLALLIGATVLGGTALALGGKERTPPAADVAPGAAAALTVDLVRPSTRTLPRSLAASGSLAARDELIVGSDANGVRLTEVLVEVGARVRRGQLLARGDDAQLQAQLAQQEALIRQAQAEKVQADANLERAERIVDSGIYSVETVQARRTAALAAAAKLELARAQRQELEVRLAHTRVLAPADGVIARRSASVGQVVQSGVELFRLIRGGELEWLAELPDHALGQVQPGAAAQIVLADGRRMDGTVRLVTPTVDTRSRNGLVHVALPAEATLKAGGHARGEIVVASATILTLPESVVLSRDGQPFVFLVGADGVARLTRISTGTRQRGLVEVTGGLEPDAPVVSAGAGFVKDGERVQVAPAALQQAGQSARNGS
ncbi:efflux RND transporter periplasmic adaptor subunit [Piscinibacter defluvii]|uniref:efflux RND transporter periplasmic adaptor subunit n=1 Tax=Piscinibacter defluvii TaxID=1796922 RepID=UPI000FDE2B41|nr:efflux RND transporter periplasmic adaptor subunit [Piscinibacter defluvii]